MTEPEATKLTAKLFAAYQFRDGNDELTAAVYIEQFVKMRDFALGLAAIDALVAHEHYMPAVSLVQSQYRTLLHQQNTALADSPTGCSCDNGLVMIGTRPEGKSQAEMYGPCPYCADGKRIETTTAHNRPRWPGGYWQGREPDLEQRPPDTWRPKQNRGTGDVPWFDNITRDSPLPT